MASRIKVDEVIAGIGWKKKDCANQKEGRSCVQGKDQTERCEEINISEKRPIEGGRNDWQC